MINNKYEAGDVELVSVKLTNSDSTATVDLKGLLLNLSIFEDIEQPTIYAELLLNDGLNLVKDFPIIGEEDLEVVFFTPGRDKMTTYKLRTFSIQGVTVADNNRSSNYILRCVSAEHFKNSVALVDKAYNTTISNMIKDIVLNEITTDKSINLENTRGISSIAIPRLSPFQAIDFLRQKAVALRASGGLFVFFENQSGYNFLTIEKLIQDGVKFVGTKSFHHSTDIKSTNAKDTHAFRNILKLEYLTKFDTIQKMNNGLFKNTVISYDILSKKVKYTDFNLHEQVRHFETGNKGSEVPNTVKTVNQAVKGNPYYMFTPFDSSAGDLYTQDLLGYKQAYSILLNQHVVRCLTYGDNFMSVGDVVELKLPTTSGTTEVRTDDMMYSGNYLVTKLRHIIYQTDRKFKYQIAMDCNNIGFKK